MFTVFNKKILPVALVTILGAGETLQANTKEPCGCLHTKVKKAKGAKNIHIKGKKYDSDANTYSISGFCNANEPTNSKPFTIGYKRSLKSFEVNCGGFAFEIKNQKYCDGWNETMDKSKFECDASEKKNS